MIRKITSLQIKAGQLQAYTSLEGRDKAAGSVSDCRARCNGGFLYLYGKAKDAPKKKDLLMRCWMREKKQVR